MSVQKDARGRFVEGTHWRTPQAFREREWLAREYGQKRRSAGDIAGEFGVTDAAILFWLRKHGIPRRSTSEARRVKHWGSEGEKNGMFGKRGAEVPSWKGGVTPARQGFYSTPQWKAAAAFVWARDAATCRRCKAQHDGGRAFPIHHIEPFSVVALRAEPGNLVVLCDPCHRWVHGRANESRLFLGGKGGAE